jgi:6-pyruvoyl-tetrahydropterin synthase
MYSLTVRDHMMIAHSFQGEVFGPARNLHGATYTVDVTFFRPTLDDDSLVVDIGLASETLSRILAAFNYRNLDEIEEFRGRNTTTEYLAGVVFERMAGAILEGELGPAGRGIDRLKVTLSESHVAWASYENTL